MSETEKVLRHWTAYRRSYAKGSYKSLPWICPMLMPVGGEAFPESSNRIRPFSCHQTDE